MQVTSGFVQAMRNAGIDVVEMAGWQGRGESGSFNIRGILLHHDAMGLHNDNVPSFMSKQGENGAQLWVKYTGQVYVLAAGLKWHAGAGRGFRNIPAGNGNAYCLGIETDYSGSGPRPAAIDEAIHKLSRVAVVYYGMDPQRDLALHKEYAPDRKIDLANFDADNWRAKAGLAQTGGPVNPTKPTPPTNEDSMSAQDVAALKTIIEYGFDKIMEGKNGEAPDHNIRQVKEELAEIKAILVGAMPQLNDVQSRVRGSNPAADMLQILTAKVDALEARIFNRERGSQSIVDEVHFGNDAILAKLDSTPKA